MRALIPRESIIGYFTVVCLVTWPLNGGEAEGDLVLIQTSLLFCVDHAVLMLTSLHLHNEAERFLSMQDHLKPLNLKALEIWRLR